MMDERANEQRIGIGRGRAWRWRLSGVATFLMASNGRVESFFVVVPANLKFAGRAGPRARTNISP